VLVRAKNSKKVGPCIPDGCEYDACWTDRSTADKLSEGERNIEMLTETHQKRGLVGRMRLCGRVIVDLWQIYRATISVDFRGFEFWVSEGIYTGARINVYEPFDSNQ
jgi:hypothetical protein